jgi:hypothetical protein
VYVVAAEVNPYGLKKDEFVGYPTSVQVKGLGGTRVRNPDGTFEEVGFEQKSGVVISNRQVLTHLMNEVNTTSNVRAGEWLFPLPFEPGLDTRIEEQIGLAGYRELRVTNLPLNVQIRNPYPTSVLVRSYKHTYPPCRNIKFLLNEKEVPLPLKGLNWGPTLFFNDADVQVTNSGVKVAPGGLILQKIRGKLPEYFGFTDTGNNQLLIGISTLASNERPGGDNFFLRNATYKGSLIFAGTK